MDLHGQSDGVTNDALDNPSGSSTASVSGTPCSHHSSDSVIDDTEDITKKDRAEIKGKKRRRSKGKVLDDVITKAMCDSSCTTLAKKISSRYRLAVIY